MVLQPPVPQAHMSAAGFVSAVRDMNRAQREEAAMKALLEGHVPSYMRSFVDITITFADKQGTAHKLVISVLPDYLTIGTDNDRLRMPLSPLAAQKIADAWGCVLPTTKLVTIVWNAATKLPPQPWGPPYDASMMSTDRYVRHNGRIEATIQKLNVDSTKLLGGHKKDVVLTNKLEQQPKQVAIFGWHQLNGKNIQPLYLGHENSYADYSHGIRLVSRRCALDDAQDDLVRIMQDQVLCSGVSSEGPMRIVRQPGV